MAWQGMVLFLVGVALSPKPVQFDNAAFFYWKAIALLPRPESLEELQACQRIESGVLPPEGNPEWETLRPLLEKGEEAMQALHQGAMRSFCRFDLDEERGPFLPFPHTALLRRLARYAVAFAQWRWMQGDAVGAAEVYGDLLRLATHLDEDGWLLSSLTGLAILTLTTARVQDFLARSSEPQALETLLQALERLPSPPFHLERALRTEARVQGRWLERNLPWSMDFLRSLAEYANDGTALRLLQEWEALGEGERLQRAQEWIREFRQRLEQLASLLQGPYSEQRRRWEEARREMEKSSNPCLRLMMPDVERLFHRFSLGATYVWALRWMCAALLAKAWEGRGEP